jgi:hypothetical protein
MNERIRELVEQARVNDRGYFIYQYGGPNGHQSVEQARADVASLELALKTHMEREAIEQQNAIAAFMKLATDHCGGCVETAKRYQHDAYNTHGDDEFLCYHLGLPYGFFKQAA